MKNLGVNIDHVATIRNARGENHPYPYHLAKFAIKCGANSITIHLREDERHINKKDLKIISSIKKIPLNLEIAATFKMLKIALKYKPNYVCLVPEKRMEITTEGGLDIVSNYNSLKETTKILQDKGILVSYFIDPDYEQINLAAECSANMIELHTGRLANASELSEIDSEVKRLISASENARNLDLIVNAGHGINSSNVNLLFDVPYLNELNVGHHLISNSIFIGIENSVREFKKEISRYVV